MVLNDVRVRRARLAAHRKSGGEIEVLLVGEDEALLRPARRLKMGERLICGAGEVELLEKRQNGCWKVCLHPDAPTLEASAGSIPLPPYLGRQAHPEDDRRYQTVYSSARSGLRASAAPTAGLHLTEALLSQLQAQGIKIVRVGLEVGLGTFMPLREEQLREGRLHRERFDMPEESWQALQNARQQGGRVVAIGTTAARVLESATGPGTGATTLFIRPGYVFKNVDLLLTNFHLPFSSLLMMVCAFGGTERVLTAYRHAVAAGYRFFSYGDAMLVEPASSKAESVLVGAV